MSNLATAARTLELCDEHRNDVAALRLTSNFIQRWMGATPGERADMVRVAPKTTFRHRTTRKWGARLAATVEEMCRRDAIEVPDWVHDPIWMLSWAWYPLAPGRVAGAALRASLREHSPEPFRRRNIFVGASGALRA